MIEISPSCVLGLQHEWDVINCTEQGHDHNLPPLLPSEHLIHLTIKVFDAEERTA